jgi:hypothetical protein
MAFTWQERCRIPKVAEVSDSIAARVVCSRTGLSTQHLERRGPMKLVHGKRVAFPTPPAEDPRLLAPQLAPQLAPKRSGRPRRTTPSRQSTPGRSYDQTETLNTIERLRERRRYGTRSMVEKYIRLCPAFSSSWKLA